MNRRAFLVTTATLALTASVAPGMAAGVNPYEAEAFTKAVAAGPVVAHIFADWCPVCKAQQPTLASMAVEPKLANVKFVAVNFDKDKEFLKANRIANQSVIVVFTGGKEVARLSGTTDAAMIRDSIMKAL